MSQVILPPSNEVTVAIPVLRAPSQRLVDAERIGAAVVAFAEQIGPAMARPASDENAKTVAP